MKLSNWYTALALTILIVMTTSSLAQNKASQTQDKATVNAITTLSTAKSASKRVQAAGRLKYKDNLSAAEALAVAMIKDSDSSVRSKAAGALWGHAYAESAIEALWQATKDEPQVAVRAAGALKSLGVPHEQLADAFRKGLVAKGAVSQFNGARGLIGIDDAHDLLPYLLTQLFSQASKSNQSGIKAAADALGKLRQNAEVNLDSSLWAAMAVDQAGNHILLNLLSNSDHDWAIAKRPLGLAVQSNILLNRMAAASLLMKFTEPASHAHIQNLLKDSSIAVVEAMAYACKKTGANMPSACQQGLKKILNAPQSSLREIAVEALADHGLNASNSSEHNTTNSQGIEQDVLRLVIHDQSDDVRFDAIKAYINSNANDHLKATLLTEVALNETENYIVSFALGRLNGFLNALNAEQKQRLSVLKSHKNAEVKRMANLLF